MSNFSVYILLFLLVVLSARIALTGIIAAKYRLPKWKDPLPMSPDEWHRSRTMFCQTSDDDPNPFHGHGKIKHAAVKWKNIVYIGKQHAACLLTMVECGLPKEETQDAMIHGCGFVTEDGEFVDRTEAYRIAVENNQIVHKHGNPETPVLYSEDLFERTAL